MALSLSGPRNAVPNGGRYPPSRPVESGLSSVARPQTQAAGPVNPAKPPDFRRRGDHRARHELNVIIRAGCMASNPQWRQPGAGCSLPRIREKREVEHALWAAAPTRVVRGAATDSGKYAKYKSIEHF